MFLRRLFMLLLLPFSFLVNSQEVNFGIIATDSSSAQRDRWEPFFRDMEKKTGLKVNSFYAPDYSGVIEAMRFNKVQIAWLGNKAAMEAVDRSSGEIFAQIMFADGSYGYHSVMLVHTDSPYTSLEQVMADSKKLHLGLGDPNSTSSFLVPSFYVFSERKTEPREAFKSARTANHGANLQALISRQVDVIFTSSEDYLRLVKTKPELGKKMRVVWKSPEIPSDPLVWRKDLDAGSKDKIRQFVLAYARNNPQELAVLKNIYDYGGFRISTNDQLNPVRQLELFKQRRKAESDEALNAEQRAKKIAEIDAALAKLK